LFCDSLDQLVLDYYLLWILNELLENIYFSGRKKNLFSIAFIPNPVLLIATLRRKNIFKGNYVRLLIAFLNFGVKNQGSW
jgi:hypothetical protein